MYSVFLHDATYLYLSLLNESISHGGPTNDGRYSFNLARNRTFRGEV